MIQRCTLSGKNRNTVFRMVYLAFRLTEVFRSDRVIFTGNVAPGYQREIKNDQWEIKTYQIAGIIRFLLKILHLFRFVLWFIFLCSPCLVNGQDHNQKFDSLRVLALKKSSPVERTERILELLWFIYQYRNDTYEPFASQLDSLYHCCIKGKSGATKDDRHLEAQIAFFMGNERIYDRPDNALTYLRQSTLLAGVSGDSTLLALSQLALCETFSVLGDSIAFAKVYEEAVRNSGSIHHLIDKISFHNNIGVVCSTFGRYGDAVTHYFEAIKEIEKEGDTPLRQELRPVYHNIGTVYNAIGDEERCVAYLQKAVEYAKLYDINPAEQFVSLAMTYVDSKKYSQALKALLQVDLQSRSSYDALTQTGYFYSLAACYRNLGRLDTAVELAQQAVALMPISTNAQYGTTALFELAQCHLAMGERQRALKETLLCFQTYIDTKNKLGAANTAEIIASIYASLHQYEKALEYSDLRLQYKQQIERQQSARQLAFGEFTRDNAAKQARREAEVKAELDRQRNIRYALFAGLGVFALLAFLLYNRYRFKQRTAAQLEAKNAEVEAARRRAEQSEAFKSRFLANMSHEIRTPLHGISGFTDLLQDTSLTEKQRRWLNAIQQSSGRLRDVVNDILDLSKLEAGEVTLRHIPFSPVQVVHEVIQGLHPKVAEKGIRLDMDVDPDVPPAVFGDPTRLYQILTNLAGNAVKFTEEGKVMIALHLKPQDDPGMTTIQFTVRDTGIGIPPQRLHAVFESFQQAEDSTTAKFGGTGLGLTIARDLVRLYGSDIQVQSEVGVGSEFSFALTLPVADAAELDHAAQLGEGIYHQPLSVLVVDDNAFNREISEEALHKYFDQVDVTFAINGREAVEKAGAQPFDIILMDMQMPEMNGLEATRHIRQISGERGSVPIVALTASATPEEIQSAMDAGMDRHLGKPFKPEELASVIATVLKLKPVSDGKPNPQHDQIEEGDHRDESKYDLTFLRDFCNGDEEQIYYLLERFYNQLPRELGRMETTLHNRDFQQLQELMHDFKSQLEFIGLKKEIISAFEKKIISGQSGDVLDELLQLSLKNKVPKTTEQS